MALATLSEGRIRRARGGAGSGSLALPWQSGVGQGFPAIACRRGSSFVASNGTSTLQAPVDAHLAGHGWRVGFTECAY